MIMAMKLNFCFKRSGNLRDLLSFPTRRSSDLTSTNFSLIDRIRGGEEIPLSEFTQGEDEITRQVIEYGGLFPFNVARMQGKVFLPPITTKKRPMTLAEKIFAQHIVHADGKVGVEAVKPGD